MGVLVISFEYHPNWLLKAIYLFIYPKNLRFLKRDLYLIVKLKVLVSLVKHNLGFSNPSWIYLIGSFRCYLHNMVAILLKANIEMHPSYIYLQDNCIHLFRESKEPYIQGIRRNCQLHLATLSLFNLNQNRSILYDLQHQGQYFPAKLIENKFFIFLILKNH